MTEPNAGGQNPNPGEGENLINQDVNFEANELESLEEETSKKIKSLDAQKRWFRDKAKKLEDDNRVLNERLAKAANPTPAAPPLTNPAEEATKQAEKTATQTVINLRKHELLNGLPEDKRNSVDEIYSSLTAGKEVTVENFSSFLETSMRAVGIEKPINPFNKINSAANGSVPRDQKLGPTPEQIELSKKFGQNPADVYSDKIDYSDMANAEKFVGGETN